MTVPELLVWLSSTECLQEIERSCGPLEADYRRRWGRSPGSLQAADWMMGRLLEEARALDIRGAGIQRLLFKWPRLVLPMVAEDLNSRRVSGECARLSAVAVAWFAPEVRRLIEG